MILSRLVDNITGALHESFSDRLSGLFRLENTPMHLTDKVSGTGQVGARCHVCGGDVAIQNSVGDVPVFTDRLRHDVRCQRRGNLRHDE